jgi:hypothetical protein
MALTVTPQNSSPRILVGGKSWCFAKLSYATTDVYTTGGITAKDAAPNAGRDKIRQKLGIGDVEGIWPNGLMSDHQANGNVLIDTGAYDLRFDYQTQTIKLFKMGRSSAPAATASEVEVTNNGSINAGASGRAVIVIGVGEGHSADNAGAT